MEQNKYDKSNIFTLIENSDNNTNHNSPTLELKNTINWLNEKHNITRKNFKKYILKFLTLNTVRPPKVNSTILPFEWISNYLYENYLCLKCLIYHLNVKQYHLNGDAIPQPDYDSNKFLNVQMRILFASKLSNL